MVHLQAETGELINFNPETGTYRVLNRKENQMLTKEDFALLKTKKLNVSKFSELVNIYFKNVKHEWIYQGEKFKKMPNFEANDYSFSTNYKIGVDVPFHEGVASYEKVILVYHWGKVYYHTISYNGYKQGQLIDSIKKDYVRWAQLKHCAPIFNITQNKIM